MSVDMYLDQSQSQAQSVGAMIDQQLAAYDGVEQALQVFMNTADSLQGQAFDSARTLVSSKVLTLLTGARLLSEKVKEAVTKFPEEFSSQVAPESLKESELREDIARLSSQLDAAQHQMSKIGSSKLSSDSKRSAMHQQEAIVTQLSQAKHLLEEKLEKLLTFHGTSPSLFADIESLHADVKAGAVQLNASWDAEQGAFRLLDTDQWEENIVDAKFAQAYNVQRPEGMSDSEWKTYRHTLRVQAQSLEQDGWSQEAIKNGYIDTVNASYDPRREISIDAQLTEFFNDAHVVGSALFNKMMTVAYKDTPEGQEKTLDMIYKVLGAKVDENGFLQMTNMKITDSDQQGAYKFTTNMDDALDFDNTFSGIVQGAYPKGLPTNLKEGSQDYTRAQKTHQFRYYMDKKNNDALRTTYPDEKNDLERIKRYNEDHPSSKFTGEKARYHNKYQGEPKDYKDHIEKYGENHKYVSSGDGFHSEFVVDKDGNLVSQWNAYEIDENGNVNSDPNKAYTKEEQMQLVDGNSVNYAESSGSGKHHAEYDSDPVSEYDPEVRKKVGEKWKSPQTDDDGADDYFDRDKSEEDANDKLK